MERDAYEISDDLHTESVRAAKRGQYELAGLLAEAHACIDELDVEDDDPDPLAYVEDRLE